MSIAVAAVLAMTLVQQPVETPLRPPPPQQAPPRDTRPQAPRVGTAVIRGRVVDGVTGQPQARVHIRIGSWPGGSTLVTDASGSFEFTKLPAGRYALTFTKRGYMNGVYPDASHRMRRSQGLVLEDGQVLENVTAPLYHGGAITGRVIDAYGDPIESVSVQVMMAGGRSPSSFQMSNTNDLGEYRVSRLLPGTYIVYAMPNGRPESSDTEDAPVPTYYPGVLSPNEAQPITVERGQTTAGMDFQVVEQQVVSVTGIVLDGTGQPAHGGNLSVAVESGSGAYNSNFGSSVSPDGTFKMKLTPGEYRVTAFASRADPTSSGDGGGGRPAQLAQGLQMGMVRLNVGTEPIANLVIATGDGSSISGRLTFDGDIAPPDPTRFTVVAQPAAMIAASPTFRRGGGDCRAMKPATKANRDGTFTVDGIHGTCVLTVTSSDPHWHARSAIYRDADLLDRPIDLLNNQAVRDVQVTVTSRQTSLTADVTDEQGQATQDYVLLAFSVDKARWSLSRYVGYAVQSSDPPPQMGRGFTAVIGAVTSSAGGIPASTSMVHRQGVIGTLPAGDYYVVALDDIEVEAARDPATLEHLVAGATRVTLRDDEPQTLQLRRQKAPSAGQ